MSKIFNVPLDYFFKNKISESENEIKSEGMQSIKELYKIGLGPSSSHTMGPEKACLYFMEKNPKATNFKVILYGSLAKNVELISK